MAEYFETEEYESHGSLRAPSDGDFNAEEDCETLRKAFRGIGTDEDAVISVLGHRNAEQRLAIGIKYKTMFGRDLRNDLDSELRGNFLKVCDKLCMVPSAVDAAYLHEAIKGAGTNESKLIEVLCTRTNRQIERIKIAYRELFENSLEDDVANDTSGFLRAVLIAQLQANRDESTDVEEGRVLIDAKRLYEAGEGQLGTDEERFISILVARSNAHIRAVNRVYKALSEKTLEEAIESEISGDTRDAMLAILQSAENKPAFFAQVLYDSMKGAGTKDHRLIHTVVTRCEVDMRQIKINFFSKYGEPLAKFVAEDVSGDYRHILMALLGIGEDGNDLD
jgi:hypothetical protein